MQADVKRELKSISLLVYLLFAISYVWDFDFLISSFCFLFFLYALLYDTRLNAIRIVKSLIDILNSKPLHTSIIILFSLLCMFLNINFYISLLAIVILIFSMLELNTIYLKYCFFILMGLSGFLVVSGYDYNSIIFTQVAFVLLISVAFFELKKYYIENNLALDYETK